MEVFRRCHFGSHPHCPEVSTAQLSWHPENMWVLICSSCCFLGRCNRVSTVWLPLFPGMSDFQYLAVHTEANGRHMSMYDRVLMLKPEKESFFHQELPLYIPPPIFSRLDTPVDYFYRPETQHR